MIMLNFWWCLTPILFLFMKVDCPEDVASYIHRVGRTARYHSGGRSVLFIMPSEMKMLEQLESAKVPIQLIKVNVFSFFISFSCSVGSFIYYYLMKSCVYSLYARIVSNISREVYLTFTLYCPIFLIVLFIIF